MTGCHTNTTTSPLSQSARKNADNSGWFEVESSSSRPTFHYWFFFFLLKLLYPAPILPCLSELSPAIYISQKTWFSGSPYWYTRGQKYLFVCFSSRVCSQTHSCVETIFLDSSIRNGPSSKKNALWSFCSFETRGARAHARAATIFWLSNSGGFWLQNWRQNTKRILFWVWSTKLLRIVTVQSKPLCERTNKNDHTSGISKLGRKKFIF